LNLRTILIVFGFAILATRPAIGEEGLYDLKYRWNPGETFSTAEVIRADGTIGEGTSSTSARFTARLIRNYKVGNPDPIRFPDFPVPLERRLESADCEVSFGTQSLRFRFTPDKMEVNGIPLWERAAGGTATGSLAPFVDTRILRTSSRGNSRWEVVRQRGLFKDPESEYRTLSVGLETISSLGGLGIPFVSLPEKKATIGETWRREADSPPLSESEDDKTSASWLTHRFEYALTGPSPETLEEIVLHVLATGDAHDLKVIDVQKLIVPASFYPDEVKPEVPDGRSGSGESPLAKSMPTPKPEGRQNLVFENYKRQYDGNVRFDPIRGRVVGSDLSGTLEMDTVSRVFTRAGAARTSLRLRLNVHLETTFDYPESR
jgi:hypothetical protein